MIEKTTEKKGLYTSSLEVDLILDSMTKNRVATSVMDERLGRLMTLAILVLVYSHQN